MRIRHPRSPGSTRGSRLQSRRDGIDLPLHDVEHAVDELDQFVGGRDGPVGVTIGDGVEDREMAVDRLVDAGLARAVVVVDPADAAEDRVQRAQRMLEEAFPRGREDQLIDAPVDAR